MVNNKIVWVNLMQKDNCLILRQNSLRNSLNFEHSSNKTLTEKNLKKLKESRSNYKNLNSSIS